MRAAIYTRVSTDGQTTYNQYRDLWAAAARAGWSIAHVLADDGISGAKGRDERPAFDQLHKLIARREVDIIMVWSVDRLGRSLQDLIGLLGELRAAGVGLFLHQQGIDTTTPAGRALFQMLGVLERVRAQHHSGARSRRHCSRQGAGQTLRAAAHQRRDRAGHPGGACRRPGHPQGGARVRRRH